MTFSEFFDHFGDLGGSGWLAVVVGTVALMVFGFLWYGPIFGNAYAAATGTARDTSASGMGPQLASTAAYLFVFNLGISTVAMRDDVERAVVVGVILGLMVIGPPLLSGTVWLGQKAGRFLIDVAHWFLAAAIAVFVQGLIV
jgi:hypothetical protein